MTIERIIVVILLVDSMCANLLVWLGSGWYVQHFRTLSRIFPPAKGWAMLYLVVVLLFGYLLW